MKRADHIAAIEAAKQAVDAVPFNGWANNEVKSAIYSALDALAFDFDDGRRAILIAEAMAVLNKQLSENLSRQRASHQSSAQRVLYDLTGELKTQGEFDDPDKTIIEVLDAKRDKEAVKV